MKRLIQLLAIVSVAGGVALLSGCQKEGWGGKGSLKEVSFGATAHSSVDTRTEYMGYNGGAYENIKWVDNDKIRIYSPDAARRVAVEAGEAPENCYYWADYQVVRISSNPTKGTLKNLSKELMSVTVSSGLARAPHSMAFTLFLPGRMARGQMSLAGRLPSGFPVLSLSPPRET